MLSVMKTILVTGVSIILGCATIATPAARSQTNSGPGFSHPLENKSTSANDAESERELQTGTALTRRGQFAEAIPHLLAARGKVSNEYAASFNLALCYVGTREYQHAIEILRDLRRDEHDNSDVENLLAQAYIGNGKPNEAFAALEKAAAIAPQNEKLYVFVADACTDRQDFALGLRVVDLGLKNLPQSPRLHYERAMLLSQLDQFDHAKADFELAKRFGQETDIGHLAAAHEALLAGDVANTIKFASAGINKGSENPILLIVLGEALLRSGVVPGESGFTEAQNALEKASIERPNDVSAQIALGQIYLASGRLDDAVVHLERARQMQPDNPSVYANLAKAYQRRGDSQRTEQALATLQTLNEAQAEKIRSAPGDRKLGYGGENAGAQDLSQH